MRILILILFFAFCFPADIIAQDSPADSIQKPPEQNEHRKFEALFFDGITQKAIENYDKAIPIFKKCLNLKPEEGIVYVELAKSYVALENYQSAEENFLSALERLPLDRQKSIKINLYQLYKAQQNPVEALEIAKQLSEDPHYQLEIVKIYQLLNRYNQALQQLDQLQSKHPYYTAFKKYRYEIFSESNQLEKAIKYYQARKDQNPETSWNYCKLMEFLVKAEKNQKALKVADQLDAQQPEDALAWRCLSGFYINFNQKDKATFYTKKIISDKFLSEKIKLQTMEQYRKFAEEHPELQSDLLKMLNDALNMEKNAASNLENARYYEGKNPEKALKFYRLALEDQPNDFKLLKKVCQLEYDAGNYKQANQIAQKALGIYPGQSIFYLVGGKSLLQLEQIEVAIDLLEEGLLYIYDQPLVKKQFKTALGNAYQAKGNEKRAKELFKEANHISK